MEARWLAFYLQRDALEVDDDLLAHIAAAVRRDVAQVEGLRFVIVEIIVVGQLLASLLIVHLLAARSLLLALLSELRLGRRLGRLPPAPLVGIAATDDGGLGGEITAEQYPEGGEGRITVTGGEG